MPSDAQEYTITNCYSDKGRVFNVAGQLKTMVFQKSRIEIAFRAFLAFFFSRAKVVLFL